MKSEPSIHVRLDYLRLNRLNLCNSSTPVELRKRHTTVHHTVRQCFPNWGPRTPGVPRGSARGSAEKRRTIKKILVEFKKKCVNDCAQPFIKIYLSKIMIIALTYEHQQ